MKIECVDKNLVVFLVLFFQRLQLVFLFLRCLWDLSRQNKAGELKWHIPLVQLEFGSSGRRFARINLSDTVKSIVRQGADLVLVPDCLLLTVKLRSQGLDLRLHLLERNHVRG